MSAKVLILDIETAPSLALVWRYWKENISPKQLRSGSYIMSIAWKWLGKDEVFYTENRGTDDKAVVKRILKAMGEADIVIAHNGKGFDFTTINARAVANGLQPPAPYAIVDTLIEARKYFNFGHNSLEHLANYLKCSPKKSHKKFPGFELWRECLAGNPEAWEELQEYNIQDVITLEEVYIKLRPWIKTHPNVGVYVESELPVCPKCGSEKINFRGYSHTSLSKFRRFQCQSESCGGWGRLRLNEYPKNKKKSLATNGG